MTKDVEVTVDGETMSGYMGSSVMLPLCHWKFTWWPKGGGRWRWFDDHIDLGRLTVADFKDNHVLWRFVAWTALLLRNRWHKQQGFDKD